MADDPKSALRAVLAEKRRALAPEQLAKDSHAAAQRLTARPEWQRAKVVALYAALGREVDTRGLLHSALVEGKRVLFPRVEEGTRLLSFAAITSEAELVVGGALKIAEPRGAAIPLEEIDLLVVPGVAFDAHGQRLGRGGGYYDETLAAVRPDTVKIGLCLELQLVESVPVGTHDQGVQLVVTEARVIDAKGR